jgi:hypothetical protein
VVGAIAVGIVLPFPDAATIADRMVVGIYAHESALKSGERVKVPEY